MLKEQYVQLKEAAQAIENPPDFLSKKFGSGKKELTDAEKAKIKSEVSETFSKFFEVFNFITMTLENAE